MATGIDAGRERRRAIASKAQRRHPRLRPRLLGLVVAASALTGGAALAQPAPAVIDVYVGTHTGGVGQGLFTARLNERTGRLDQPHVAAEIERPTWQVVDPDQPLLFSVSETGNDGQSQGSVYSFAITPGSGQLAQVGQAPSGGGGPTFLDYDPAAKTLFVANFGGGQVASLPVGLDGALSPPASVVTDYGSGPSKRQTGPHAHAVVLDPSGRYVLVPDLGADRVFVYRFDPRTRRLSPAQTPYAALPPGSGPRHLVFSPDGGLAFLDTELSGEVYVFRWDAAAGRLAPLSHVSIDPPDFQGQKSASELALSRDGRVLYVGDRGANAVVVYAVAPGTGALSEVQRAASGGQTPWSFALDPTGRWLLVANEASSLLTSFAVDASTGRLTPTGATLPIPKPVSVSFYPAR